MPVGCDRCCREIERVDPLGEHQGKGVVLACGVTAVGCIHVFTVNRRLQAHVQGKVVHGAFEATVRHRPFPQKC